MAPAEGAARSRAAARCWLRLADWRRTGWRPKAEDEGIRPSLQCLAMGSGIGWLLKATSSPRIDQ